MLYDDSVYIKENQTIDVIGDHTGKPWNVLFSGNLPEIKCKRIYIKLDKLGW